MTLIDQDVDAWLERLHLANTPPLARSRAPALGRAESSHSGELGLIRAGQGANGQVAVTAALWTGGRAWPLGALLYLPAAWTDDTIRRHTHPECLYWQHHIPER